jgi:hypothetical protein
VGDFDLAGLERGAEEEEEEMIVGGHRLSELIGRISFAEGMFLLLRSDLPSRHRRASSTSSSSPRRSWDRAALDGQPLLRLVRHEHPGRRRLFPTETSGSIFHRLAFRARQWLRRRRPQGGKA